MHGLVASRKERLVQWHELVLKVMASTVIIGEVKVAGTTVQYRKRGSAYELSQTVGGRNYDANSSLNLTNA
jgi:hypothetical protein